MSLWDFLKQNKTIDYTQNMPALQQPLEAIQVQDDGQGGAVLSNNVNLGAEQPLSFYDRLINKTKNVGSRFANAILGEQALPTDNISKNVSGEQVLKDEVTGENVTYNPQENITASANPRVGGILNDIANGAKENFVTGFAAPNLYNNKTPDGRDKGFAYRIGEGIGSLGRFMESPLGRSLLVGGLVGVTGGNGLQALAYGGGTGVLNQQNRMKDRAYRDSLINTAQQARMAEPDFALLKKDQQQAELNAITNRINNYRGYIGDDVYGQMIQAQQLRDNAAYRNALLASNLKNREYEAQLARENLDYRKKQDAIKNAQEWEKINNDKNKGNTVTFNQIASLRNEFTRLPAIKNANEIKRQFDNVTNTYNAYKNGKLKANAADQAMITTLNKILDPTSVVRESEFARTAAGQSIFARMEGLASKLAKGGGGLTDAEREDLYTAMQEMYEANQAEANAYIQSYTDLANRYGINPADIMPRQYYVSETSQQKTYPEGTIIKNKQGQRMIMRDGQWQAM